MILKDRLGNEIVRVMILYLPLNILMLIDALYIIIDVLISHVLNNTLDNFLPLGITLLRDMP